METCRGFRFKLYKIIQKLECYEPTKIGTGLTEEGWKNILNLLEKIKTDKCPFEKEPELELPNDRKPVWVKLKYVYEAKFMNLSKDLLMRAPVYVRLRENKKPKDCNLEGVLPKVKYT